MKIIGVTGGVGAGKSTVLNMLKELCHCTVIMADDVAKDLMQYGHELSEDAIRLFGENAYSEDGSLNRIHLAECIYQDHSLLETWNGIVHPATNLKIKQMIDSAKTQGYDFVFVEAALLIENHYEEICDEIWYVYAPFEVRSNRLQSDRGYSLEKVKQIDATQLSEEEFRKHSQFVIHTGVDFDYTRLQLEKRLEQYV